MVFGPSASRIQLNVDYKLISFLLYRYLSCHVYCVLGRSCALGTDVVSIHIVENKTMTTGISSRNKAVTYYDLKRLFVLAHMTQRGALQQMIELGLTAYMDSNGDSTLLTDTIRACEELKASQTNTVQKYIMVHANLVLKRDKAGKLNFRKAKVKIDGKVVKQEATVTWPKYTYWEHDVASGDKADTNWSADKYAKQVLSKLKKEGAGIIQAKVIRGVIDQYIIEMEMEVVTMKAVSNGVAAVKRLGQY